MIKRLIPVAEPDLGPLEEQFVLSAVKSGWVSSIGEYIMQFEKEFALFCDTSYGVSVCNGTVALHLALKAADIGPGDEVIVPALTFVATAAAVCHAGATPVFVDCEAEIGTLDIEAVSRALTPRTKAIIPVHLYGHPVDMDPLLELARSHKLLVIEDAAEAHGALYRGRIVGGLGDMATFSFYGNKILTTGEGGMVTTKDDAIHSRLRILRDHAMDPNRRYWHPEIGYNYRMTNVQAALGVAQLQRYEEISGKRRKVLEAYRSAFAGKEEAVIINPHSDWAEPATWLICALLPEGTSAEKRDLICGKLRQQGFDSRPYFIPLHHMPPYRTFRSVAANGGKELIVSDNLAARGFNLPSSTCLSEDVVNNISSALLHAIAMLL